MRPEVSPPPPVEEVGVGTLSIKEILVVVRHTRKVTYDTKNLGVKKVEDKFTMVDDGQTEYQNAFAIVYPEAQAPAPVQAITAG